MATIDSERTGEESGFAGSAGIIWALVDALRIVNGARERTGRELDVVLACGFTPLHLATFLNATLQATTSRPVRITAGGYNDLLGTLRKIVGERENTAATAVVVEWQDLDLRLGVRHLGGWGPAVLADVLRNAEAATQRLATALEALAETRLVALCLPTLPLPPIPQTAGWQTSGFELELAHLVSAFGARMSRVNGLRVLHEGRLARLSPMSERFDLKSELLTGFPYSRRHAAAVGHLLGALMQERAPKKGLITDLDDTLWNGLLGEIGSGAVSWDLSHHSHEHGVYQQFVGALAEAGVLIGVVSKNDGLLVEKTLQRSDLLLRPDLIYPVEAGWGPKSAGVARVLEAWNVAPDSVVFVDDSPLELAEVKAAFPDIVCQRFPKGDPKALWTLLEYLRDAFGKPMILDDDKIRVASLRANAARKSDLVAADSDEFLSTIEARVTVDFKNDPKDTRALELVNKTNQFNINGHRYLESDWRNYLAHPNSLLLRVSYKDKFGPLGTIAVLTGRRVGTTLRIDTWVMSCRAFSRRVEHQCIRQLFSRFDFESLTIDFCQTERNGPVAEFLNSIGAKPENAGTVVYREEFERRCPPMFHDVRELAHG